MADSRQSDYFQLCDAIKKKDKVRVCNLILNNADVNNPNAEDNTLVHLAIAQFHDLDILKMLLDKGVNVHIKNHNYETPLEVAIQNNRTPAAILLIKKGALMGENFNSLLLKTIQQNNYIIFKNLIDNGTHYNRIINLDILFKAAISRGNQKIIEQIIPHCRFLKPLIRTIPRKLVIKSEYKDCVELLLKQDFTINPNSHSDKDFVYGAVENGHVQIVLQLLKLGIDVNMINLTTGLSLLKVACLNKHHEVVENLLKHNANVNETTPTDYEKLDILSVYYYSSYEHDYSLPSIPRKKYLCNITCLHIAVLNSDPIMTKLLLRYGAKIIDDPRYFNITCIAVQNNCEEIVRIFLDHGVDAHDDPHGKTLLHFCVNYNKNGQDSRYNIVKLLLEKGAAIHIQTPDNILTFKTIINGHRRIAQLFLDYNANIQYIGPGSDTLLHMAIERDFDVKFIKTLLKLNAPVYAVNNELLTPLLVACRIKSNNQLEIIKALLDYNANVNCNDHKLMTPLHFACQSQYVEFVTFLLEKGANSNATNDEGQTPLHIVCKHKSNMTASIIKLLLEHNANIEAVDIRGWTPLFEACKANNYITVKSLLDHDANADHIDSENITPLYVAAKHCGFYYEIVDTLLKHKVNIHCMDKEGNSIIHVIVKNRNRLLIESLSVTQVNFNAVNKEGNTPLHIAIKNESDDITKTLIKYGANINILDKKNRTPLQNALRHIFAFRNKLENNHNYNSENYLIDTAEYKQIVETLKMQGIKMKTAGLKVNNKDLRIAYNSNNDSDYEFYNEDDEDYTISPLHFETKCKQEIEKMRTESIGVNTMTLYDLLQKNIHLLSRYVKNKQIQQKLALEEYDKKFPLYIDIVRSRFRDAKLRYRLMNSAKNYFSSNVCKRLSDDCLDTVFSYLNIKEIKMFIRAMKLLD